jgi:hypothetical protein
MSNVDAPNGFTPSYHLHGGTVRYNGKYTIASALASDIFLGDTVIETATGQGTDIDVGGTTGIILGVFAGCQYTAANGDVVFAKQWVSGTVTLGSVAAEAFVYTDPNIVFTAQANAALLVAEVGQFMSVVAGAGNVATGVSGFELNQSTAAATILQWRVLRFAPAPDGIALDDLTSLFPRVECQIAQHAEIGQILA